MRSILLTVQIVAFLFASASAVRKITPESWNELRRGEWMIKFYAPWCPACRQFAATWSQFEDRCRFENLDVQVAEVDVAEFPSLGGRMSLRKLPSIYHVKNGEYRSYEGNREITRLLDFVKNSEYEKVEPLSAVWHPDGIAMIMFSYLYSASVQVKAFQDWFVEEKGYSSNLFYGIFFVGFIMCGLLLGLILVLISIFFEWLLTLMFGKPKQHTNASQQQTVTNAPAPSTTAAGNATGGEESSEAEVDSESVSSGGEQQVHANEDENVSSDASRSDPAAAVRRRLPRKD